MSRKKEPTVVEACDCSCDCPADVLEAGTNGQDLQAVADLAGSRMAGANKMAADAASRASDTLNAATNRASDALDRLSTRMDDLRKQMRGGNGWTKPAERLGIAAALAGAAGKAQDRQSKAADTLQDVKSRASDRLQDAGSSAADALQNVADTASDRLDDLRSMAADRLDDLSKALPRKRKPSIWQRLALAGMTAGLIKQLESGRDTLSDSLGSATKKAKRRGKLMTTVGAIGPGAMLGKRKAEKQAKQTFGWLQRRAQPRRRVSPLGWGLALGLGAGLMYFFDPQQGNRRRALVRDQFVHYRHMLMDRFGGASEDIGNRAQGMVAEAHRYTRDEGPSDGVLAERVRSQLGFLVSHPGSIDVTAANGVVILRGPILAAEVEPLLTRVRLIPGVTSVENRLDVYQQPGDVPGLQGGVSRENS